MRRFYSAFTLAELLIALLVLGVIATFTIPKVLQSQQSSKNMAIVKEAASIVSGAYEAYKHENTVTSAFKASDLTPYINYVSISTNGTSVDRGNTLDVPCSATTTCYLLHNGGTLNIDSICSLAATTPTRGVLVVIDPDGVASPVDDVNAGVWFTLFVNGRITTMGKEGPDNSCGTWTPNPTNDPPWLSWS